MNPIHFFIFMIFPTFLLGNDSEKIEKKLNKAWNYIHEMPDTNLKRTPLWDNWLCKENSESKCQKICAKCQEHNAECHNAKCKENCEKCQKHRGECHFEACREHLNECHEWKKFTEKILGLLLRWDEVKTRAKHSAAKQIEDVASKNGNCDGKCKKRIEEEWRKSMLGTLLTVNANDYMECIEKNNDYVGTSADSPFTLNLHMALKAVEQANVALMEGQQMPGLIRFKDEALYFKQMNKWNSWLTGSAENSAEEELSNNGTTDADDSPRMAQTSAMDIKNLAPRRR